MSADTLIAATTGTASAHVKVTHDMLPMTVFATGLAGAEKVDIQISPDDGTTPADIYQDGSLQSLTATNTVVAITSPGYYTLDKEASASAAAVYVARKDHI